ncbi:hypothetical protein AVEN_174771-1 [Araneus ventricosus]|uniref:Uncharacterized protein n=1 Tax=Araneus ventricosus TaxID=182803 RepID=A0A4Y2BKN6_ARAVE|nr:hypothetical protein AVEN_174771-1 [Araneus ventricosus]
MIKTTFEPGPLLGTSEPHHWETFDPDIRFIKNKAAIQKVLLGIYSGTPGWVGFRTLTTEPNRTPNPTGGTRIDPLAFDIPTAFAFSQVSVVCMRYTEHLLLLLTWPLQI